MQRQARSWLVCYNELAKLIADRPRHGFFSGRQRNGHIRHLSMRLFLICDLADEYDLGTAPRDLLAQVQAVVTGLAAGMANDSALAADPCGERFPETVVNQSRMVVSQGARISYHCALPETRFSWCAQSSQFAQILYSCPQN